jgi:HEPN domain-containing protein
MNDLEMSDPEYWVRNWLQKADADARAMHLVMEGDDPLTGIACFHAQQCAEKCLKAFLTAHERVVEKTHDLTDLHELCVEVESDFRTFEEVCSELTGYAVEVRYPGEEDPSVEQARTMIEAADRISRFTRDALDLDG